MRITCIHASLAASLITVGCTTTSEPLPRAQATAPPVVESPFMTTEPEQPEPLLPVNTPPFSTEAAAIEVFDDLPAPDDGLIRGQPIARYADGFLASYVISYCIQAKPQPFTMRDAAEFNTQYRLLRNALNPTELNAINRATKARVFNSAEFDECTREVVNAQLEHSTAELGLLNENLRRQPDYSAEPVLTNFVAPIYPRKAMTRGLQGKVVVAGTIGTDGLIYDARVVNSEPPDVFDKAALEAFSRERYTPRYEKGKKVPTENYEKVITFKLQ